MVAGEGVRFADLFAPDGVLRYPFAPPGMPRSCAAATRSRPYHGAAAGQRDLLQIEGVDVVVRETDDPRSSSPRSSTTGTRTPPAGRTGSGRSA